MQGNSLLCSGFAVLFSSLFSYAPSRSQPWRARRPRLILPETNSVSGPASPSIPCMFSESLRTSKSTRSACAMPAQFSTSARHLSNIRWTSCRLTSSASSPSFRAARPAAWATFARRDERLFSPPAQAPALHRRERRIRHFGASGSGRYPRWHTIQLHLRRRRRPRAIQPEPPVILEVRLPFPTHLQRLSPQFQSGPRQQSILHRLFLLQIIGQPAPLHKKPVIPKRSGNCFECSEVPSFDAYRVQRTTRPWPSSREAQRRRISLRCSQIPPSDHSALQLLHRIKRPAPNNPPIP